MGFWRMYLSMYGAFFHQKSHKSPTSRKRGKFCQMKRSNFFKVLQLHTSKCRNQTLCASKMFLAWAVPGVCVWRREVPFQPKTCFAWPLPCWTLVINMWDATHPPRNILCPFSFSPNFFPAATTGSWRDTIFQMERKSGWALTQRQKKLN